MLTRKNKTGMTLIEVLIVVAIVALLVGMVLGIATSIQDKANEQLTRETFSLLEGALEEYHEYLNTFPTWNNIGDEEAITNSENLYAALSTVSASMEVLQRINTAQIFDGDGDEALEIYDAWRQVPIDYFYVSGNTFPRLVSAGADTVPGTGDDLSNR